MNSVNESVYNSCAWLLMFVSPKLLYSTYTEHLNLIFTEVQNANLILSTSSECTIPFDRNINLKTHIYDLQQRFTALQLSVYNKHFNAKELELFENVFTRLQFIFNFDHLHQMLTNMQNTTFWGQLFVLNTQLELERLHGYLTTHIGISILTKQNSFDEIIRTHETNITWLSNMIQQTMTKAVYDPAAITVILRHLESLVTSIMQNLETTNEPKN
jgi:flagellar biosynthesis protein FlhB